ncbi:MAG: hypothetical protein IJG38_14930 [Thermoguttaceae bacterium]|nr:hypothetical protein [Thermoguttaceae bacterium]
MEKYKKTIVLLLKILLAILAIAFCIFGYDVHCHYDIYSGKFRTRYCMGPVCFYSHIEETEYSLMLKEFGFSFRKAPQWKYAYGHGFTLYYGPARYCSSKAGWDESRLLVSEIRYRLERGEKKEYGSITKDAIERLLAYNVYLLSYPKRGYYSLGDEITRLPLEKTIDKDSIPPPDGYSEKLLDFVNFPDDYVHSQP